MSVRIPDAEATAFPWWAIIDPSRVRLPHPVDVGDVGPCKECGAGEGDACTYTELDDPYMRGEPRDEPHDEREDYRDRLQARDVCDVMTGPFLSREAAESHLKAKRHRFSRRAEVWCLSGSASWQWLELCKEVPRG